MRDWWIRNRAGCVLLCGQARAKGLALVCDFPPTCQAGYPAICHRLAEQMGGSITLESVAGAGSTFTFDVALKLARVPAQRLAALHASFGRDPGRLRRKAHALSGAARSVGLLRLAGAASVLQGDIEGQGPDGAVLDRVAELIAAGVAALADRNGWRAVAPISAPASLSMR